MSVHPTATRYFLDRIRQHDRVAVCVPLTGPPDLYRIERHHDLPSIVVYYSDAYRFGPVDFELRPKDVAKNSFILLLPHANADASTVEAARSRGVGIGHLRKLMGALNFRNVWEYRAPEEQ